MTPEQIDRVFGCGRLQMVTGKHVEVFREAAAAGTRRRYTKRFLHTLEADFGQWTEREWRILARLIGHGIACVPDVVQYDRGTSGGTQLVQTYDAGVTVDQWATILPVTRNGRTLRHVFEDCAHWWALAHHCLRALQAIHELSVVHLDLKGDNVCIPFGPPGFDPHGTDLSIFPRFADLALIDFAFALVSRESLTTALPIGWQTDYDYQSPRLLHALEAGRRGDLQPTRQLDWRCDMYSLGAMLKRYLPDDEVINDPGQAGGWSAVRVQAAKEFILALREVHDGEPTLRHPHARLLELTEARIDEVDMAASLAAGWTLARDANVTPVAVAPATPVTRLAPPLRVIVTPRVSIEPVESPLVLRRRPLPPSPPPAPTRRGRLFATAAVLALVSFGAIAVAVPDIGDRLTTLGDVGRTLWNDARSAIERPPSGGGSSAVAEAPGSGTATSQADAAERAGANSPPSSAPSDAAAQADAAAAQAGGVTTQADAATAQAGAATTQADAATPPADASGDAQKASSTAGPVSEEDARAEPAASGPGARGTKPAAAKPSLAGATTKPPLAVTTPPLPAATSVPPPTTAGEAIRPRSSQAAKPAASPPRSAKLADARPRTNASGNAKLASSGTVASPPKRIRFFDGEPTRSGAFAVPVAPVAAAAASTGEPASPPASAAPAPPATPPTPADIAPAPVVTATAPTGVTPAPPAAAAGPARVAPGTAARPSAGPPAGSESRNIFTLLADLALRRDRGKAPIEDRAVPSARAPLYAQPPSVARASPIDRDTAGNASARPGAYAGAPVGRSESPAPVMEHSPALTPAPAMAAAPTMSPAPAMNPAQATSPAPAMNAAPVPEARTYAVPPVPEPRPIPRELAPRFAPPGTVVARDTYRGAEPDPADLAARARRALAESVPYAAARAQGDVARVLRVAAYAAHPGQESEIRDAVRRGWTTPIATNVPSVSPASARQLSEEARRAYVVQRNVNQAFDLQLRAFGANPGDPDLAGDLAYLLLKANPTQAETARQLALHAIALRPSQLRAPLADDWSTLAIASGLTGREADATNAWYVVVALSRNLDRDCRTALGAIDKHGDVMLGPVQAMMLRIRYHDRHGESPNCAWPVNARMARGY